MENNTYQFKSSPESRLLDNLINDFLYAHKQYRSSFDNFKTMVSGTILCVIAFPLLYLLYHNEPEFIQNTASVFILFFVIMCFQWFGIMKIRKKLNNYKIQFDDIGLRICCKKEKVGEILGLSQRENIKFLNQGEIDETYFVFSPHQKIDFKKYDNVFRVS